MSTVKYGIKVDTELNDSLNRMIPDGLKARLLRNMLKRLEYELRTGGDEAFMMWLNWRSPDDRKNQVA